jgi:hypothetical protein
MKYLSWDENGPCVLGCRCFVTRFADDTPGHQGEARPLITAKENTE